MRILHKRQRDMTTTSSMNGLKFASISLIRIEVVVVVDASIDVNMDVFHKLEYS